MSDQMRSRTTLVDEVVHRRWEASPSGGGQRRFRRPGQRVGTWVTPQLMVLVGFMVVLLRIMAVLWQDGTMG